jgi:hypothetical protein
MIHIPFFLPLFVGGLASAVWRGNRRTTPLFRLIALPKPETDSRRPSLTKPRPEKVFDDMNELHHYQRVSWYSLAFSASGLWFYPPATLVSIPLLSYNLYNFVKTLEQTEPASRKSPRVVFEIFGVVGTLVTGRFLTASLMFLFVFASRNLLLQTKNLATTDFSHFADPSFAKVWVLHDGAEIEVTLGELQAGDIVVVQAGNIVLIEGTVVDGQGIVLQYSLQRKIKSVLKQAGDRVFPFTQLESGCLHIQKV